MCPRSYYYHYIKRVARPLASWLFLGGCAHEAIGYNFEQKIKTKTDLPVEEMQSFFSDRWDAQDVNASRPEYSDSAEATEIDWKGEDPGLLKDIGIEVVTRYRKEMAPKIQPIAVEMEIPNARVCGLRLVGRIDLIDSDATIIDLKTAKKKPAQKNIDSDLQPTFYAVGMGGEIDFKFHYMVKRANTEVIEMVTKRTKGDIEFLENQFLPPIIQSIEKGIFIPNVTSWSCSPKYCEFYDICQGNGVKD
jgi:hypothetical protein